VKELFLKINPRCFRSLTIRDCIHLESVSILKGGFDSADGEEKAEGGGEEVVGELGRGSDFESALQVSLTNLPTLKTFTVGLIKTAEDERSARDVPLPPLKLLVHNARMLKVIDISARNVESVDVFPRSSIGSVVLRDILPSVVKSIRCDRCSLLTDDTLCGLIVPGVEVQRTPAPPRSDSLLSLTGLARVQRQIQNFFPCFFTSIDFSLSFNLTDIFVESLLGVAFALRHLTLDSCNSLQCPLIQSSTLETLRMAHCVRLVGLRFSDDAPSVLRSVDLRQCQALGVGSSLLSSKKLEAMLKKPGASSNPSDTNVKYSPFPLSVTRCA
jgi:hypothetical protein